MGRRRGMRPEYLHTLIAGGITLLLTAWAFLKLGLPRTAVGLVAAWLGAISVVTFCYFGYDKWRAREGSLRVPEVVLHGLTLLGGSLAAWLAMRTFRHKTIKSSFRIVFWGSVFLQLIIVCTVAYILWKRA